MIRLILAGASGLRGRGPERRRWRQFRVKTSRLSSSFGELVFRTAKKMIANEQDKIWREIERASKVVGIGEPLILRKRARPTKGLSGTDCHEIRAQKEAKKLSPKNTSHETRKFEMWRRQASDACIRYGRNTRLARRLSQVPS